MREGGRYFASIPLLVKLGFMEERMYTVDINPLPMRRDHSPACPCLQQIHLPPFHCKCVVVLSLLPQQVEAVEVFRTVQQDPRLAGYKLPRPRWLYRELSSYVHNSEVHHCIASTVHHCAE